MDVKGNGGSKSTLDLEKDGSKLILSELFK